MSKKHNITPANFEKTIMAKVKSNEISMKPRWYFVLGSLLMVAGLAGFSVVAVFLTNLTLFLLRQHGPMGQWRLQILLSSFPLWVPVLAIAGIVFGIGHENFNKRKRRQRKKHSHYSTGPGIQR